MRFASSPVRTLARRLAVALALLAFAGWAAAQSGGAPPPPKLEPLPEPPPPPGPVEPGLEPQITIIQRDNETVEEYRINNRLYMIKVTPRHGVPYYLIDDVGQGRFIRRESHESGLRVPMWVIRTF